MVAFHAFGRIAPDLALPLFARSFASDSAILVRQLRTVVRSLRSRLRWRDRQVRVAYEAAARTFATDRSAQRQLAVGHQEIVANDTGKQTVPCEQLLLDRHVVLVEVQKSDRVAAFRGVVERHHVHDQPFAWFQVFGEPQKQPHAAVRACPVHQMILARALMLFAKHWQLLPRNLTVLADPVLVVRVETRDLCVRDPVAARAFHAFQEADWA